MKRFEYLIVGSEISTEYLSGHTEDSLDKIGEAGWELIHIIDNVILIFKREKSKNDQEEK